MLLANKDAYDPYRRSLMLDCTTRFNGAEVASFAYMFDAGNRPVTRNADTFTYNVRDEILSAVIGTNTFSHAYDTIGNHTQCVRNGIEYIYANNALNQTTRETVNLPSADGDGTPSLPVTSTLTWSAQGGLATDGKWNFAFDAEDQLASVTSATMTNGAIRVVNAYDYRHRRISKTVYRCVVNQVPTPEGAPPSPASTTTWDLRERHDFVYDDWNLIHETITSVDANSITNITEVEYFWGPDLSNTLQGAGGVGGLLAVSMNGLFYFPVYDNLGNIVKYLDESGTVVAAYDYDDFGRLLFSSGSMSDIFTIRFSTKYYDVEIDLYYYGYRYYSPFFRFWLCRDPFFEYACANIYGMSGNNPIAYIDFFGLSYGYIGPYSGGTGEPSNGNPAPTASIWMAVFGEGGFTLRRTIRYSLCDCDTGEKINDSADYFSVPSHNVMCFSNPRLIVENMGRNFSYAEVVATENTALSDQKGTVEIEIQVLPSNVDRPTVRPMTKSEMDNVNLGFGTENRPPYADQSDHPIVNYKLDGTWKPKHVLASIKYVVEVNCNGEMYLKEQPLKKGDWSLNDQGWRRVGLSGYRNSGAQINVRKGGL